MSSTDSHREFAVSVVRRLREAGFESLWAGGCVRDLLLGRQPDDYDVATNATPDQVQQIFGKRQTLPIGASFGVILVRAPRKSGASDVEVATFRTEGPYLDGRRPEHVSFATAAEDAQRRDFTINGMFYDPIAEQLLDYVGGREDLERHIVRAIGDPLARFTEDKLRMLRAVRIAARFDFDLEPETARAIQMMSGEILVVSGERIAQEFWKMLVHPRRARAVRLARELGLLSVVLPELGSMPAHGPVEAALESLELPDFELAFATLLTPLDGGDPIPAGKTLAAICRRLKLSNKTTDQIVWLVSQRAEVAAAPGWPVARLKRFLAQDWIRNLLKLARAMSAAEGQSLAPVEFCEDFLSQTPPEELNPEPLITGDDLIRLGLKPGAQFKQLLEQIRDAQLEGAVKTPEEALRLAKRLIT